MNVNDESAQPVPTVSPDGYSYWNGTEWQQMPGRECAWDGFAWQVKPPGVESQWNGTRWVIRPAGISAWSGTDYLVKPDGVESQWNGAQWIVKPEERCYWDGQQWKAGFSPGKKATAAAAIAVLILAIAGTWLAVSVSSSNNQQAQAEQAQQKAAAKASRSAAQKSAAAEEAQHQVLVQQAAAAGWTEERVRADADKTSALLNSAQTSCNSDYAATETSGTLEAPGEINSCFIKKVTEATGDNWSQVLEGGSTVEGLSQFRYEVRDPFKAYVFCLEPDAYVPSPQSCN